MLDRELKIVYNFNVIVIDKGNFFRFSMVFVIVYVLDVNDNMSRIIYFDNYNNIIKLMYIIFKDSVIVRVEVDDIDEGNNFVFFFFIFIKLNLLSLIFLK